MASGQLRILLVDDDEDDYIMTHHLLSEINGGRFHLQWVDSYDAALEAIASDLYDLYLLDYNLGAQSGLQLLNEALSNGCKAPIILLTGQGNDQVDLEAMKAGAADYLVKGQFNAQVLGRSIRYAIERQRTAEQILQSQKMESVGRLAGGVAHDFNNLLTAIMGYTQMGMDKLNQDHFICGYLQQIQRAARRAADLTQQLLAFSRLQTIEPKVINLNDLILDLDRMLRRLIGEDIELVVLPAAEMRPIKVDPGQMEQVLVNLAVNARDAMPVGGKLTIQTANVALAADYSRKPREVPPGEYVMLTVSDTGSGMTEEVKDRLFEPFFTTKKRGQGTGLGLASCYGIVKQSGGHIEVGSTLGQGTTFRIYLPCIDEITDALPQSEESGDQSRSVETVLLVEDETLVRGMVTSVLQEQGYKVLTATNGDEALRLDREHAGEEIHLLLTDVVMPSMGGQELSNQLRAIRPNIKVLFTSGYSDDTVVHHGILESGIEFMQKPFSPATLARRVRQVLEQ